MKIAILGTRGVPNHHGGFEQFAEFFSVFLKENGHNVYVYNSSNHPYKKNEFKGVKIINCYDPENKLGTIGQFIYDLNCIIDSRKRNFDIILQLGYTSSSIWGTLLPKKPLVITNMDGLEWKRTKYSPKVQKFLKYAEKRAINTSDFLVSDSIGIKNHLLEQYNAKSKYIAYGAEQFKTPDVQVLKDYFVNPYKYNMLIARLEPENNIETILDGIVLAKNKDPFLVIGKHNVNSFGKYLKNKFKNYLNIKFLGGIYDLNHLNNLRHFSNLYFHGHSVGGTNPSLLEAMASKALIIANNNQFNMAILKQNALYFSNPKDVRDIVLNISREEYTQMIQNNYDIIKDEFNWNKINSQYLTFFINSFNTNI